jgi:ATP-binding cassette subfamily C protein CydD
MNLDRRLVRELTCARAPLAATIGLSALGALLLVGQAYGLSRAISGVFLDGNDLASLTPLLAALALIAVGRALALGGSELAAHALASRVKGALRERLLVHLAALGPAYVRGERSGELANTAVEGVEALHAYLGEYIPQLVLAALIPLTMLVVVFPLDPLSALVLLVTAPMIPFLMILIGKVASLQSRRQWTQLSRMSAHFLDALQGLPTLKMFGQSRAQIAVIGAISERFRDATMSVLRVAFLSALVLEMLATISVAIIAVEIGLRLLYGRMDFADALFILILAPDYYLPLRMLGTRFHAGVAGVTAAGRIFAVLETPVPGCEPASPAPIPAPVLSAPFDIRFEDVRVVYSDGERPALDGVTLRLPPGQAIALVGPSGAGKSTLAGLLLRFAAPTAGRITANGHDLCAVPADVWRAHVAWVPQRPTLFNTTIAANIRLGRPAAPDAEVIRAAQQAGAEAFIAALPDGYETRVGERGARLSGGQAQRIALARAFLKDAPLIVLDEATANLDPQTEAALLEAMRALLRGRTALVIAHRLRTVRHADQIVVLSGGRIVQAGTHVSLQDQPGLYQRLLAAQEMQG